MSRFSGFNLMVRGCYRVSFDCEVKAMDVVGCFFSPRVFVLFFVPPTRVSDIDHQVVALMMMMAIIIIIIIGMLLPMMML